MQPDSQKEVDVVTILLSADGVCIRPIECSKSDSSNKALDDYSKLVDLRNYLEPKRFADLTVETKVLSASKVPKDFLPVNTLLSRFDFNKGAKG